MAEGVERNTLEVHVGVALADIVLVLRGYAIEVLVDGVGQMAARVVYAEERAGDGVTAPFAGIPRTEDGGKMIVRPRNGKRTGIFKHKDGLRVSGVDGFEELFLCSRKIEVSTVTSFSFDSKACAKAEYDDIAFPREISSVIDGLLVEWINVARTLVELYFDAFAKKRFKAANDADFAKGCAIVVASFIVVSPSWADNSDRLDLLLIEREEILAVKQERHGLCADLIGELEVRKGANDIHTNFRIGTSLRRIEGTETEAYTEDITERVVELFFREQAAIYS
jgi:hypothetical protein